MTGNSKVWRAPVAGLASVAMLATLGVSAMTANAASSNGDPNVPDITFNANEHGYFGTSTGKEATYLWSDAVQAGEPVTWSSQFTSIEPNPVSANWQFTGWYMGPEYGAPKFDPTQRLESDVTLYAHWSTDPATVTFADGSMGKKATGDPSVSESPNSASNVTVTIAPQDVLADWQYPVDVSGDGNLITGWTSSANTMFDGKAAVGGDLTLRPVTEQNVVTVTYDIVSTLSSEFTAPASRDVVAGSTISDPWLINGAGTAVVSKWQYNSNDPSKNTNRTAVWNFDNPVTTNLNIVATEKADVVEVTFASPEAQPTSSSVYVLKNKKLDKVPAAPYRYGYEFVGWDGLNNSNGRVDTPVDTTSAVTSPVTYYAEWRQTVALLKNINFDLNYDGAPAAETHQYTVNSFVDYLPAPSREGYTFDGWFENADGTGQKLTYDTWIGNTTTRTFYAHWSKTVKTTSAEKLWDAWGYPVADATAQSNRGAVTNSMFTEKSFDEYEDAVQNIYESLTSSQRNVLNTATKNVAGLNTYFTEEQASDALAKLQAAQDKLVFKKTAMVPVYRVFKKSTLKHHYTMNKVEMNGLLAQGWKAEGVNGVAFYVPAYNNNETETKQAEEAGFIMPVYRVFNKYDASGKQIDRHFFTSNEAEYDSLCNDATWRDEGIGWYTRTHGELPVYRTYSSARYEHLFTTNQDEAENSVSLYGYRDEGVAFYAE